MNTVQREDNCFMYYRTNKDGDEVVEKITNYDLTPICIVSEIETTRSKKVQQEYLLVRLTKEKSQGQSYFKTITGEDEEDSKTFIKKIHQGTIGLWESFNKNSFNLLKELLHEDLKVIKIYKNLGYQHSEEVYISGLNVYDYKTNSFLKYPLVPNGVYITKNELLKLLPEETTKITYREEVDSKKEMDSFFTVITKTYNHSSVLVAVAVVIATAFYDLFVKYAQGFPFVILYGDPASGKTTLLYCLAAVFGIIERSLFISGTSTVAGFRNQLAKNNNRCVFCDEIEQKLFDKFIDLGKDSFSGTPRKKSSSDGSEVVTEINTSFCATTNYFFQNFSFAGVSRAIIVNMQQGQFDLTDFPYHSQESLERLTSFLGLILAYRNKILSLYHSEFKVVQKYSTQSRLCNNVAIAMAIWKIINEILGKELVNTETLAKEYLEYFDRYLDTELKYGDVFLSDVYKLFTKKELVYGRDFLITKGKYLRINLSKFCEIYNSNSIDKLNTAQLRLKLANDKRFNLKSSDIKPIGKAIKVDISENATVLDIKNHVTHLAEDEEYDNNEKEE